MSSFWRVNIIQNTNLLTRFYIVRVHSERLLFLKILIVFILKGLYHSEQQYYYYFLHGTSSFWRVTIIKNANLILFVSWWYEFTLKSSNDSEYQSSYSFLHGTTSLRRATNIQNTNNLFRFFRVGIYFKELLSFRISIFSHMTRIHCKGLLSFRIPIY